MNTFSTTKARRHEEKKPFVSLGLGGESQRLDGVSPHLETLDAVRALSEGRAPRKYLLAVPFVGRAALPRRQADQPDGPAKDAPQIVQAAVSLGLCSAPVSTPPFATSYQFEVARNQAWGLTRRGTERKIGFPSSVPGVSARLVALLDDFLKVQEAPFGADDFGRFLKRSGKRLTPLTLKRFCFLFARAGKLRVAVRGVRGRFSLYQSSLSVLPAVANTAGNGGVPPSPATNALAAGRLSNGQPPGGGKARAGHSQRAALFSGRAALPRRQAEDHRRPTTQCR